MDNHIDDNKLVVKYGSIYTPLGTAINNVAVIIDKDCGLIKFGEEYQINEDYKNRIIKYEKAGLKEFADNLILVSFDRYDGALSIDEICTFVNYMRLCSANGSQIMTMLKMEPDELKKELKKFAELGF